MELFLLGEIYREHGLHGQAKVYVYSGNALNLRAGQAVWLESGDKKIQTRIQMIQPQQKWFLVRFECFQTPEDVRAWRKAALFVDRKAMIEPEKGEEYLEDLIGRELISEGALLGKIVGLVHGNPNPHFLVKKNKKEILIPVVKQWIKKIEADQVTMSLPEGLVEAQS